MEMLKLRRRIGVAFQGGALFSSMNVLDNIMLPLREHTRLDPKTMEIMARMKLEVVSLAGADRLMPSELSGGMMKRAAVARAIVMDPKLLFFDEPSAGLDPVVSSALDDLILKLRDAMNMTMVVVTHELESAFKIADRITVLDRDVPPILQKADALMLNLDAMVDDARGFTSEGNRMEVEQLLVRLNAAAADLDRLTGNANTLVDEARALIADVKPDVNQSLANVRYLTGALARDIDTINRNLEGASRNMHEFSRQIRQNPGLLLHGTTPGGSR
jgi:ABC-type nitrate/sulfonate/bicarbonate transport system ATPase subunit